MGGRPAGELRGRFERLNFDGSNTMLQDLPHELLIGDVQFLRFGFGLFNEWLRQPDRDVLNRPVK
jgi:hypothetical protein